MSLNLHEAQEEHTKVERKRKQVKAQLRKFGNKLSEMDERQRNLKERMADLEEESHLEAELHKEHTKVQRKRSRVKAQATQLCKKLDEIDEKGGNLELRIAWLEEEC